MAFPDAVALVIAYLDNLHSIPVVSRVPATRPASFIQVRRVGGTSLPPVRDVARVDVFSWAADEPAAATLGGTVRAQMFDISRTSLSGVQCYRIEETLFRQLDDPDTGSARTWGTYALTFRADDAIA